MPQEVPFQQAFNDRGGQIKSEKVHHLPKRHTGSIACYLGSMDGKLPGSFVPVIMPNGDAFFCCQDFGLTRPIGNFATQSAKDIYSSPEFRFVYRAFDDDSIETICRYCECGISKTAKNKAKHELLNSLLHNAVKAGLYLEDFRHGILNKKINAKAEKILKKLDNAETIAIYGLGKIFRDIYFPNHWNEVIKADYFCDGNPDLWRTKINGIPVVSPEELGAIRERTCWL